MITKTSAIPEIRLGKHTIGSGRYPFIVAEMSGNHNQSLERALALVEAAAEAGVQAVKLQTYTADTMTLNLNEREFQISDPGSLWKGQSLYDLYKQAYTPWEWHEPIMRHCEELGLLCFSSPFDASAVDFLENLNVPCYKIASFENTDLPLIRKCAQTGKPIIISCGMASPAEIFDAVEAARSNGCKDLILLKTTSTYPARPLDTNIATIPHMADLFKVQVGLSDHTMGIGVPVAAVAYGAVLIEKHFTLRREDGGVDSAFSAEPQELKQLVEETRRAVDAIGTVSYGAVNEERKSKQFRRSLYAVADIKKGTILNPLNVRAIRPGFGLPIKFLDVVLGMEAQEDIPRGTPLAWNHIAKQGESDVL